MTNYAVIGNASTSGKAIREALKDIVEPGDSFSVIWDGKPSESLEAVYDFLVDAEDEDDISGTLFHATDDVPKIFRESDNLQPYKTKHPINAMLDMDGDVAIDKVLFLWDDDEDEANDMINDVFDRVEGTNIEVLELSNGLTPIVVGDEAVPEDSEPEEEEEEDDTEFTKEELEISTAYVVKRYGERKGCKAKTKAAIIAELFPDGKDNDMEEDGDGSMADDGSSMDGDRSNSTELEEQVEADHDALEDGPVHGPEVPDGLYVLDLSDEQELIGIYRAFKYAPNSPAKVAAEEALLLAKFRMRKAVA